MASGNQILLTGLVLLACFSLGSAISCFVCSSYPSDRNNSQPYLDKGEPCADLNATTTKLPLIDCNERNNFTAAMERRPNKCITVKTWAKNSVDGETMTGRPGITYTLVSRFCGYSDKVEDVCELTDANQAEQVQCWCGTDGCNNGNSWQISTAILLITSLISLIAW